VFYIAYASYKGMPNQPLIALVLFIFSLSLFFFSIKAFRSSPPGIAGAGIVPEGIVEDGPYRIVRHPIYTAYQLFWAGVVAAAPGAFSFLGFFLMGVLYYREAKREEDALLASPRAGAYAEYCLKAGMFVPRIWFRRR
jgi:protein-S-isoprenylcysteine O-methyltransferase Ste14